MSQLMDDVTVRVTIEVTKRGWDSNTIAKASIEETSSCLLDELADKIDGVVGDATRRALTQLANTRRIKALEQQNRLLAEGPKS